MRYSEVARSRHRRFAEQLFHSVLDLGDRPRQGVAAPPAETERRRHADATQPTLAPIDAFPDDYATADDLATVRLDADPDATGPHSRTIRGLLGGACDGWRVRPTSVELYHALRADNPTRRQRSIATVLINEASFEELVNAHTEGAFTWRQLARAARRQNAVPPRRILLIDTFAITAARRHAPAIPARRGRASPGSGQHEGTPHPSRSRRCRPTTGGGVRGPH